MAIVNKLRRDYVPGGPLFATRPIKFHGTTYAKRAVLPVAEMSKVRHHRLWLSGLASHTQHGPFDKPPPAPTALPAATVQPGPFPSIVVVGEALDANELAALRDAVTPLAEQVKITATTGNFTPQRHKRR